MPAEVMIDDMPATISMLPNGCIEVMHPTGAFNALHGAGTGGMVVYQVHPCQRHQYEHLNAQLPPQERGPQRREGDARPWWSSAAGERAGLKE